MSAETVIPSSLAVFAASMHTSPAFFEIAGVIPVKWNQSAPSNTFAQSTSPGLISEIEDAARS